MDVRLEEHMVVIDGCKHDFSANDVRTRIIYDICKEGEKRKSKINDELNIYRGEMDEKSSKLTGIELGVSMAVGFLIYIVAIARFISEVGVLWGLINGIVIGLLPATVGAVIVMIPFLIFDHYGKKIKAYKDETEERIKNVDEETKKRIENELKLYDYNVKTTYQKVISNPANIDTMIDYSIQMFKRMISHADSDSNMKFIECNFKYIVTTTEIKYWYDSEYTNPRDDFNFSKQRYRDLHYEYECEGLALALAQAVSNKMKTLYPPNTLKITISNEDAKVVMNFKAPNENFVVARDIV